MVKAELTVRKLYGAIINKSSPGLYTTPPSTSVFRSIAYFFIPCKSDRVSSIWSEIWPSRSDREVDGEVSLKETRKRENYTGRKVRLMILGADCASLRFKCHFLGCASGVS